MAVTAFVRSLMRCHSLPVESGQDALLALMEDAITQGTDGMRPELRQLYDRAWQHATDDERGYLPIVLDRIENGSLAERITRRISRGEPLTGVLSDMADCLRDNRPYGS